MITAIGQIIASRRLTKLVAAALLALVLSGCSGSSYQWEGTWEGNMNIPPGQGMNEVAAHTLGITTVTLNDGRFELFSLLPKKGSVRYADGKAYLKIETIMDRPVSSLGDSAEKMNVEIVLTPIDKNTITYQDPGEARRLADGSTPPPVKLTRKVDDKR